MIYLYTGGSGSGKSAVAEEKILSFLKRRRYYLATMAASDFESKKRIQRHRQMRQEKEFETIERYTDIGGVHLPKTEKKDCCILLECMSNLLANEMYLPEGSREHVVTNILSGVKLLEKKTEHLVIVTNEIFSDIPIRDIETRKYLRYLGELNTALCGMAEEVTEVVYGIEIPQKRRK